MAVLGAGHFCPVQDSSNGQPGLWSTLYSRIPLGFWTCWTFWRRDGNSLRGTRHWEDPRKRWPRLASLYPRKDVPVSRLQRLRPQWWIVSLLQSPLLWLWCPEQVFFQFQWSNSFKKQSDGISKSSKLGNQGDFITHIYSTIQHLTRHPEASCKLPLLPPRQNAHVASQTLKIKWKSSRCAGWNLLSWKVPASTPASW